MATKKLTRKQETFVATFVETGIGSEAAREAYDIAPQDTRLASVMAAENLAKPSIQIAVAKALKTREELVKEAHESLLTAVKLDYFVFPKSMSDIEIQSHVEAQGLTCVNIRPSEKGKLAFFTLPDGAARAKGAELHYKLEGAFAAEKHLNLNVEVAASEDVREAAKILNDHYRKLNSGGDARAHRASGNGTPPSDVGAQTPDTK